MATEAAGDLPLTLLQIQMIRAVIKEQLPTELEIFIGVRP
ncbi:pyocin S6 family toxin immunity protein [Pseudomonas sp. Pseusp122]